MSTEIEATYRVVTPMFCGGADPEKSAELRLPSFKGVLRFWWRALAWSRYGGNLRRIRELEDALFGSAGGGQSRVSMRLEPDATPKGVCQGEVLSVSQADQRVVGEGARYLGYGVMEAFANSKKSTKAGELTRACLRAPFDFTVHLRLRDQGLDEGARWQLPASLNDALICLGTHGGMGAKSRKGYGSLVIRSLRVDGEERWRPPRALDELRDALAKIRRNHNAADQPEYTALSGQARHVLISSGRNEAMELLDLVGRELMRYRSWGHKGRVLGKDSEKNFRDDHDLMKSNQPNRHPRRIAFGLPHNYGKQRHEQVVPDDQHLDRRASPLFIHIHECGDTPIVVLSLLPARFLPEGRSDIAVGGVPVPQTREEHLYRPIHEFLGRLLYPKEPHGAFTDVVEVTQ